MKKILVIGSVNMDLVVHVGHIPVRGETILCRDMTLSPGGKGANQAYAAAVLGGSVSFLGAVGDDGYGETLLQNLRSAGVDVSPTVKRSDAVTGNAFIMVDTLHAGRAGVSADELKRTDPKYFRFIHLCDGPAGPDGDPVLDNIKDELMLFTAREGRLYPGEGVMDIAGMIKAMPEIPLSIELPNLKEMSVRGAAGHAARCLEVAKSYFKANGIE